MDCGFYIPISKNNINLSYTDIIIIVTIVVLSITYIIINIIYEPNDNYIDDINNKLQPIDIFKIIIGYMIGILLSIIISNKVLLYIGNIYINVIIFLLSLLLIILYYSGIYIHKNNKNWIVFTSYIFPLFILLITTLTYSSRKIYNHFLSSSVNKIYTELFTDDNNDESYLDLNLIDSTLFTESS
jgi:uncharacterized protein YacL